jgi:hypothetical protein
MIFFPVNWIVIMGRQIRGAVPVMSQDIADLWPKQRSQMSLRTSNFLGFHELPRTRDDLIGQYSHSYSFQDSSTTQVISLDMPFRGDHPLNGCYELAGWNEEDRQLLDSNCRELNSAWPVYRAKLKNDFGEYGLLHYVLLDRDCKPFVFETTRQHLASKNRGYRTLFHEMSELLNSIQGDNLPLTFQLQLFVKSSEPFSEQSVQRWWNEFLQVREQFVIDTRNAIDRMPDDFR